MEIWKTIENFEEFYEVSNLGNIRSKDRITSNKHFIKGIKRYPRNSNGYYRITLQKNGKCKNCALHRLVAIAFISNLNNYPIINHKDGNKLNNSIENLEWCSYKENAMHAHKNKLIKYNTNSVLENQTYSFANEIWKKIQEYPKYEISNLGRIRKNNYIKKRILDSGYYRVHLSKNNKQKTLYVHVLLATTFIKEIPKNYIVNHKDGNKLNNNLSNLEIITKKENVKHAYKNGLIHTRKGENHQNSKLKKDDIIEILRLRNIEKLTQQKIADKFNISREHARAIINNKKWKHISRL